MITIGFITAREEPKFNWFLDSLNNQMATSDSLEIILVDLFHEERGDDFIAQIANHPLGRCVVRTPPKPNVWNGRSRLPKDQWWATSSNRNTALCLCRSPYICWVDDRCVLADTWLGALRDAVKGNYAVCGTYEKRRGMVVENGIVITPGELTGSDHRSLSIKKKTIVPGPWFFGGTQGMSLDWALNINGYEELMDGVGMEDCMMGMMLANNGQPVYFDPRLKIIEDRTPDELGYVMKRTSKEKHPNDTTDKTHEAIRRFGVLKTTSHHWNLRAVRNAVLAGHGFPPATEPTRDWYDNTLISEAKL